MSTHPSLLIIGAGIAGLSAGIYAQKHGLQSTIFEMHDLPGGLCTAWERKGYVFDGCIHYLFGSGVGQPFYDLWDELGIIQDRPFIHHREYMRLTDGERTLIVYTDPDQLEEHLLSLSPQDARPIRALCRGVRDFARFDMAAMYALPKSQTNAREWAALGRKMLPYVPALASWASLSCLEFGARFKDPFLRRAVPQMFSWEEAPLMMGMMLLAYMGKGNAGFPMGGSLKFAQALEQRYLELGGQVHYKAQVEKILVENGAAVGVRLYNDEIHPASVVISAADGHATIFDMLGGKFTNRAIRSMYDGHLPTHQMMQISLGVHRDFSAEPHWVTYLLDRPILLAGEERRELGLKHYCFDPSLSPPGKSVLELILRTNYAYWQRIYGRKLYDTEQTQVSEEIIARLEAWYPGITADIEVKDEATPLSYERYTGNWMGATCGWLLSRQTLPLMIRGVPKTLPGLRNFYLAGQWVEPGGTVTLAAASGRQAIQMIAADLA
ncbi:MAG: NAD(P)/FAD-dependent oxidoreductase [Anaerolineales bacterium]|jgi:phytoene dehydrogenase-like protein|nr:NAD(P)/FAD-dependent oxidoreductase [Anaerolineales bacterium]